MRTPLMYGLLGAMSASTKVTLQAPTFFTTYKSSDHYLKCDLTPKQKKLRKKAKMSKQARKRNRVCDQRLKHK